MVSIQIRPWLSLIILLLLGGGVGWYLATNAGAQSWLAFVAAWAGASAGILAMPLFEILAKPLPNPLDHRIARLTSTFITPFIFALAARSLLITGLGVGEVIGKGFLCGFLPSAYFGVYFGAYRMTRGIGEKLIPPIIFILTVLSTILALNVFAFTGGIAGFGLEMTVFVALIYATAQIQVCIVVWVVRSASNYSAFQSLQILALIFGIGLSLGGVTSLVR